MITPPDVIKVYEARIASAKAVLLADAQRAAAVKAEQELRAQTRGQTLAYKRLILAMFAEALEVLHTFALKVTTPTPPTTKVKAAAADKEAATRKVVGPLTAAQKKTAKARAAAPSLAPVSPAEPPAAAPVAGSVKS